MIDIKKEINEIIDNLYSDKKSFTAYNVYSQLKKQFPQVREPYYKLQSYIHSYAGSLLSSVSYEKKIKKFGNNMAYEYSYNDNKVDISDSNAADAFMNIFGLKRVSPSDVNTTTTVSQSKDSRSITTNIKNTQTIISRATDKRGTLTVPALFIKNIAPRTSVVIPVFKSDKGSGLILYPLSKNSPVGVPLTHYTIDKYYNVRITKTQLLAGNLDINKKFKITLDNNSITITN